MSEKECDSCFNTVDDDIELCEECEEDERLMDEADGDFTMFGEDYFEVDEDEFENRACSTTVDDEDEDEDYFEVDEELDEDDTDE